MNIDPQPATKAAETPAPGGKRTTYLLPDGRPDASVLQDRTPEFLKISRPVAILVSVVGLLFTIINYFPLYHSDLWGHLAYGRWIVEHGAPTTEPLMPLDRGVPFIDLAWLSQVLGYQMYERFGVAGIQFASACCLSIVMSLLVGMVYSRTKNHWAALLTLMTFLVVDSQQIAFGTLLIPRPQLAGMACFSIVFAVATSVRPRWWHLVIVAITFALWSNLHGSFVVGLTMLGVLTIGRYIDFTWRARHLMAGWRDSRFRWLLLATELAAVCVLINPYGIGAYGEALAVANSENVRDLVEWEPLTLRMMQGQFAAIAAFVLVCLYRLTPRRITSGEVLLLIVFGGLALWTSRMIVWWAPMAAYFIGLHLAAALRRWWKPADPVSTRAGLNTVVAVGLCWIYFAYSPFGVLALHGPPKTAEEQARRFRKTVSQDLPVDLNEWLHENPLPAGQVFNCYEWGDYLMFAGPPKMQLFVNSHVHLIPTEVWTDYRQVSWGLTGDWQVKLDRYGVNSVIMDKLAHEEMVDALKASSLWEKQYEDRLGAVFVRRKPI